MLVSMKAFAEFERVAKFRFKRKTLNMEDLIKVFKMLELTRNQPQYGYALAGISKSEQSDLAQHQYLVSMIALQLAYYFNAKGAQLNVQNILEISMTHDLGELFGGDINYFYGRGNKIARQKAKEFEAENVRYIAKTLGDYGAAFQKNLQHFEGVETDEAIIAQVADKIECVHYKIQLEKDMPGDIAGNKISLLSYAAKCHDADLKTNLETFINTWCDVLPGKSFIEILADEVTDFK